MINTLSKINLSKIEWEGGGSTSIWILPLNILLFFLEITPKEGRQFRRTGKTSKASRGTNKLLEKSTWFKKRAKEDCYVGERKSTAPGKTHSTKKNLGEKKTPAKTVMFVEYTPHGVLAKRLREVDQRLESITGFGIKLVEKTGIPLVS